MSVRILDSEGASGESGAILFDSVTGWTLGPLFEDRDEAEAFLEWVGKDDPRAMSVLTLAARVDAWNRARVES